MLTTIYGAFVKDDLYSFYERIRKGDEVGKDDNERQCLNKSFTIFDEVSYLETQGLLPEEDEAWEYVASEIQYFARNPNACNYMMARIEEGIKGGFPKNIVPFTGFPFLLGKIPLRFQVKKGANGERGFPCISEEHQALLREWGLLT